MQHKQETQYCNTGFPFSESDRPMTSWEHDTDHKHQNRARVVESTASLSLNHFPNPDPLCSNHLRVVTSTSGPKPEASDGHKYLCMSLNDSQEFNRSFANAQDCSMSYLKIFPLNHLHPFHSL